MKLKRILKDIPLQIYRGSREIEITGLSSHSKTVAPGNLFIAKKGSSDDGSKYIDEALNAGASAILSDMGNPFLKEVAQLIHPNISEIEGRLASLFYEHPTRELLTVGITGTNGKTTTTYLIKYLFDELHLPFGLIGTIEYIRGEKRSQADRTTPDVITNHKFLREMVSNGCKGAVFEVTSHGLVQGRVDGIDFKIAIFTNLTHDHLDYHGNMENYAKAKSLLFDRLSSSSFAIINNESEFAEKMVQNCRAKIITYGFSNNSDLFAHDIHFDSTATMFKVTYKDETCDFHSNLIGRYNVLNVLAAIASALSQGHSLQKISEIFARFPGVRGRLERVGSSPIFVDYAHSPDALEKVLTSLREVVQGRLIVVFGCGGDRDRFKRPVMAEIAEKLSDLSIVTSDNPRSEDPLSIIEEIKKGFKNKNFLVVPDRRAAIEKAISLAKEKDLILIAGKGHETVQISSHQTLPFDDRKVAMDALKSKI